MTRRTAKFRWPLWAACFSVGTVAVFGVVATRLNDDDSFVGDPHRPELGALHDPGPELQLPIPPRAFPLVTWTGREIAVFGGLDPVVGLPRRPRDDGAAYDPSTRQWRAITAPGFDPPLLDPSGIWLGSALVVVGEPCDDHSEPDDDTESCQPGGMAVGLYEPDRDTWRIVPPPPTPLADEVGGRLVGQRDGAAVVAVGGGDELWLLDPITEHWSPVPSPPLTERFCADNENIIAIGVQPRPVSPGQDTSASVTDDAAPVAPPSEPPTHLWSATLPAGSNDWTQPAPIPAAPVCAAGTAYIPAPTPLRLDPVDNTLVPLPPPPMGLGADPIVTTADDRVVFWPDDRSAVSFTPSTQQWRITKHQNGRRPDVAIWTGGQQFLLINEEAPGYTAHLRLQTLDL